MWCNVTWDYLQTYPTTKKVVGSPHNGVALDALSKKEIFSFHFHYETQNQTFLSQLLRHSAYLHIYTAYAVYSRYNQDTSSPLASLQPVRDTCAKHQATNVATAKQSASKQQPGQTCRASSMHLRNIAACSDELARSKMSFQFIFR